MRKTRIIALVLTGAFAFPAMASARPAVPPPRYTLTALPALPGGDNSGAYAINSHGWVVGWADAVAESPSSQIIANHAVLWRDGQVTDLGLLIGAGYEYDAARSINDRGQIVGGWAVMGVGGFGGFAPSGAFLWEKGHLTIIDERFLHHNELMPHLVDALAINGNGLIAGSGRREFDDYPAIWQDGKLSELPLPVGDIRGYVGKDGDGFNTFGVCIDLKGEVVGTTLRQVGNAILGRPVIWRSGRVTDLGAIPPLLPTKGSFDGNNGEAVAINNKGQIVGRSNQQAFLWELGKMKVLPPLLTSPHPPMMPGQDRYEAYAVNDQGWAVGYADARNKYEWVESSPHLGQRYVNHAVLWKEGVAYDLNDLVSPTPPWELSCAYGINDSGQIVGEDEKNGHPCAFLLTPITP